MNSRETLSALAKRKIHLHTTGCFNIQNVSLMFLLLLRVIISYMFNLHLCTIRTIEITARRCTPVAMHNLSVFEKSSTYSINVYTVQHKIKFSPSMAQIVVRS